MRRAVWAKGYRFRKNDPRLPGRPDITFARERVAVFCDGDFWHGRDWEDRHRRLSAGANSAYWVAKIARNMQRDQLITRELRASGWTVVRLWEREILQAPELAAAQVIKVVNDHRKAVAADAE